MYYRKTSSGPQFLTTWVDNLLGLGNQKRDTDKIKEILSAKFEITNLGEPRLIVGMEILQDQETCNITEHILKENTAEVFRR